jgi:hypothetical protein
MIKDIVNNHRQISSASERFIQYATDRNGIGKMQVSGENLSDMVQNYEYPLHAWPWFISPATKTMLAECVQRIPELVARSVRLEFDGRPQEMAHFFEVPDIIAMLFLDGMTDMRHFVQRTDAVLTERGLKVVEINVGSTIGGWQIQWMDGQYRGHPELADFFDSHQCISKNIPLAFMEFLVSLVREKKLEMQGAINIIFVVEGDLCDTDAPAEVKRLFNQVLAQHNCVGSIHFQKTLEGIRFTHDGVFLGNVRMSAVLCGGPPADGLPQSFYRACFARQVWWSDSPVETVLGDKRTLAIAYKYKNNAAFNDEERSLIERFIPWSVTLQEGSVDYYGKTWDLRELLIQRQNDFVVKLAQGLAGNDVYVGKFTSPDVWCDVVNRGLDRNGWIAQEYCVSLPFYGQSSGLPMSEFDVIWGVFGFGKEYGGCWLRLMERAQHSGVINSAKGAEETIVYEVEE